MHSRKVLFDLVEQGAIEEAISQANELFPTLLSQNPDVHFALRAQQFVELVRAGSTEEALAFLQTTISPFVTEARLEAIENLLILLVYEDPSSSPSGELLQVKARKQVADRLNRAILEILGQPRLPRLERILRHCQIIEYDK